MYGFAAAGSFAVRGGWPYSVLPAETANEPPCEVDSRVMPGSTTGVPFTSTYGSVEWVRREPAEVALVLSHAL